MAKMGEIEQQDQKLARLEKEYPNCDWASSANIWIIYFQGDDTFPRKSILNPPPNFG